VRNARKGRLRCGSLKSEQAAARIYRKDICHHFRTPSWKGKLTDEEREWLARTKNHVDFLHRFEQYER
jgi:hypothetical protein